jgi:hypothetical protein
MLPIGFVLGGRGGGGVSVEIDDVTLCFPEEMFRKTKLDSSKRRQKVEERADQKLLWVEEEEAECPLLKEFQSRQPSK